MKEKRNHFWSNYLYSNPKTTFIILVVLFLWPISFGVYALQYDAIDVYLPWRYFGSESLRLGQVPLWNPYQDGGYPFYADHQYSMWNPELFIGALLGRFSPWTLQLLFIFYFWMGGVGFLFLGKQLNLSERSRFWGGILFMFSGVLIGHGQSVISILGAVWLPWAIGGYLYFIQKPLALKQILTLTTSLFLMLTCGYQAVSIMLFYVLLAFFLIEVISHFKSKTYKKLTHLFLGHFFVVIILTVLMAGTFYSIYDVAPYLKRLGGLPIEDTDRLLFHPQSLESLLLPLSSVFREMKQSTISTQNIFMGTTALFFCFLGVVQWKKWNVPIKILGFFAIIYGIMSFGAFTPVQPLLAELVPGFNQFYYASFYRFFLWLFLIILFCKGLEKKEVSPLMYRSWLIFSGSLLFFFLGIILFFRESFTEIQWSSNYISLLRNLDWKEGALLNAVLQFFIVGGGILLLFIRKRFWETLQLVLLVELFVCVQLMLPITIHENAKTATLSRYLSQFPEGFHTWENQTPLDNGKEKSYISFWRNQGNFSNTPSLDGWTSFHLAHRDSVYDHHPELREELGRKTLFYTKNSSQDIQILRSNPRRFVVSTSSKKIDTLVFQQANYPGWTAKVNGKELPIFTENIFEMGIQIPKGNLTIEFEFDKPVVRILYFVSMFGFLVLLFALWWTHSDRKKIVAFVSIAFFSLVLTQLLSFNNRLESHFYTFNSSDFLSEKKLTEQWRKFSNDDFKISSGKNNLSAQFIARTALESSHFKIDEATKEITISGKKTTRKEKPLHLDSTQMYYNILESTTSQLQISGGKRLVLVAKAQKEEELKGMALILTKNKGKNTTAYLSIDLSEYKEDNGVFVVFNSLVIPYSSGKESFSLYLYNIENKERNLLDFSVKII